MSAKDYFRPRGDITTVLDLTDRDSQDNTYFPINAEKSWFHRGGIQTTFPTTMSIQEFTQRGPADWGQTCTFEIGSLPAGDLLHAVVLQLKLGSWYNGNIISQLTKVELIPSIGQTVPNYAAVMPNLSSDYWTYINSLGTSIIEYADFIVNNQTIERLTGEFIKVYLNACSDVNSLASISADATGTAPYSYLAPPYVNQTPFAPQRPYPTEDGTYFCMLPFFFLRTPLNESFPLLSCNEGNVRIDIKLRPFDQVVRKLIGYRATCTDTPLNAQVPFATMPLPVSCIPALPPDPPNMFITNTAACPPDFRDFRIVTQTSLLTGTLRNKFLRQPFEQMVKLVQLFSFEEPLKYLVSKPNSNSGTVEIQLPLELNHPVTELLWVFRRKAVLINNEWSNFTPAIGLESSPTKAYPAWLEYATLRVNGSEVIAAEGDWFRDHIAKKHSGGLTAYQSSIYGFSFAEYPEDHQPSGTANMSRATSVTLRLRVRTPIAADITTLSPPCSFDPITVGGWEVFVYAMHYNWLRFENGICNRLFTD
jgi:hypothetical protein